MTHTSRLIVWTSRSAIRRRTGVHRQGDWLTNCCKACMFPSGSRWAIGWIDLRRPSSISPRPIGDAEARLAYVAVTRTRQRLDLGGLSWIHDHPDVTPPG